jgi:hypothetical protein
MDFVNEEAKNLNTPSFPMYYSMAAFSFIVGLTYVLVPSLSAGHVYFTSLARHTILSDPSYLVGTQTDFNEVA